MRAAYLRLSQQTIVSVVATFSIYARNLVLIPLLTRLLDRAEYGAWVQIIALVEFLIALASLNLSSALLRFLPKRRSAGTLGDDLTSVLLVACVGGGVFAILGVLSAEFLATAFLGGSAQVGALRLAMLLLPIAAVDNLLLMYFRASRKIGTYSLLLSVESVGYVACVALPLIMGGGIREIVVGLFVLKCVVGLMALWLANRQISLKKPTFSCVGTFLRFCLPLLPLGVFSWVNNIGDRYVIGAISGPEAVGVYAVSYALGSMVGLFFAPMFFALDPALTEAWEEKQDKLVREYLYYGQKYPLLLALPATVVISVYNNLFIELISTSQYVAHPALVALVALGIMVMNLSAMAENVVRLLGNTGIFPVYYGLCALVNILSNIVLVWLGGYYWAAVTTLGTYGLQWLLMHFYLRKHYPFSWNTGAILRISGASLVLGAIIWPFKTAQLEWQALGLLMGGVGYVLLLLFSGAFERRELQLVRLLCGYRAV